MSALSRYAAAIYHLGPRQAALNLLHRARQRTRWYGRYARPGRGLEWRRARAHRASRARGRLAARRAGASRPSAARPRSAIRRTGTARRPLLWLFNLHYFGWLAALPSDEQRRLVLDWILRYRPSGAPAGLVALPVEPAPAALGARALRRRSARGGAHARAGLDRGAGGLPRRHARASPARQPPARERDHAQAARGLPARPRHAPAGSRLADSVLDAELAEQFLLDGGHFERSPMYHALLVHGLLDLVNVLPDERRAAHPARGAPPGHAAFPRGDCAIRTARSRSSTTPRSGSRRARRARSGTRLASASRLPLQAGLLSRDGLPRVARGGRLPRGATPGRSGPTTSRRTRTATSSPTS